MMVDAKFAFFCRWLWCASMSFTKQSLLQAGGLCTVFKFKFANLAGCLGGGSVSGPDSVSLLITASDKVCR